MHCHIFVTVSCEAIADPSNIIIDVRSEEEWDKGHLGCAHLLPLSTNFTEENLEALTDGNKNTTILIHCGKKHIRAAEAVKNATEWGYTNVTSAGGYKEIVEAGCSCAGKSSEKYLMYKLLEFSLLLFMIS